MAIYLDGNAHEARWRATRANVLTGESEPATGLTLRCRIAATENGAAIDDTLDIALLERGSTPGDYYGTFTGPNLDAYLAPYVHGKVWEIVYDSSGTVHAAHRHPVEVRVV